MDIERQACVGTSNVDRHDPSIQEEPARIRILVVTRTPLTREGLVALLNQQSDFHVVDSVPAACECDESIATHQPRVIVFESGPEDSSFAEAVLMLRTMHAEIPLVVISGHDYAGGLAEVIQSGVQSYLLKNTDTENLYQALRITSDGGSFIDPALRSSLAGIESAENRDSESARPTLTQRELGILNALAQGCTNDEIAELVSVRRSTVKYHLGNIFEKLRVTNRTMAVAVAVQNGQLILRPNEKSAGSPRRTLNDLKETSSGSTSLEPADRNTGCRYAKSA